MKSKFPYLQKYNLHGKGDKLGGGGGGGGGGGILHVKGTIANDRSHFEVIYPKDLA